MTEEIAYIPLTRGLFAMIDAVDYAWLSQYNWQAIKGWKEGAFYAKTDFKKKCILMHRLILDLHDKPGSVRADHENNNGLDNRRKNLRRLSGSYNNLNTLGLHAHNTSGAKGVYFNNQKQKWCAEILFNGRKKHLGFHTNFDDAVNARKREEERLWSILSQPT